MAGKKTLYALLAAVLILTPGCNTDHDLISLAGAWQFTMDSLDTGIDRFRDPSWFQDTIILPGSMRENGKGNDVTVHTRWTGSIYDSSWYFLPEMEPYRRPGNIKFPFWLTPVKCYTGPAWYQKAIDIPHGWKDQRIVLFLERVHTESMVWVDGREAGTQNSLVAPHEYDLTPYMTPGKHLLTLRIDNRIKEINVGPDSHSITDHTQGNWNGVIGRMELRKTSPVYLEEIQVYPDPEQQSARVAILVRNSRGEPSGLRLSLDAKSFNSERRHHPGKIIERTKIEGEETLIERNYPFGPDMLLWDEFSPNLYRMRITLISEKGRDRQDVEFGMRTFRADGTRFTINGRPIFLRGNCDCAIFPITGYPPMKVDSWERIFAVLRDYGFNHVRYHSWCPPEAAFRAADRAGFYLQPEGPSWANHGTALGYGLPIDRYIYDETSRMSECYGNHPSFVMLACGNEPAGRNQAAYLGAFVNYWKEKDGRRVYTGASVGKSWPFVPEAEYIVKSYPRGLPWNRPPQTLFDYRTHIEGQPVPYVSHETGQYCAFPDFREIEKYSGVSRAGNFEIFRDLLGKHDMGNQAGDFLYASGKLQLLCYKHEIEAALRTPGFAGFQMLQLNDFPGQGSALVGVLNAFYENKGYTSPQEFRQFCNSTVPLARIPKFVYTGSEYFTAGIELSHFGPEPLGDQPVNWEITGTDGEIMASESITLKYIPIGNCTHITDISFPLYGIKSPAKLSLRVSLTGTSFLNAWDFWVYPDTLLETNPSGIYSCRSIDKKAIEVLNEGGTVFLRAAGNIEKGKEVVMHFEPVFWNTSWFQMRPPHTTGIVCDSRHPVFTDFPTAGHSDLQWWEILHRQQVMNLDGFPEGFRPLIQPIDTWFISRRLGVLFEARVGNGKIMVTSIDFESNMENRPAARQLLFSIEKYINSDTFNPAYEVNIGTILNLMKEPDAGSFKTYTRESPEDLKPASDSGKN
ncbi:MAG: beta-glucuronidase [Bacteroidales bacterium]|nr:beta-glucuronidase [Bacteroidales bacterium]